VEVVETMSEVIRAVERDELARHDYESPSYRDDRQANPIASAAKELAARLGARSIIAESATGQTARNISSLRPVELITMVTHTQRSYNQLSIIWGAWCYLETDPVKAADTAIRGLKDHGAAEVGDKVVVVSGHQPGIPGGTDSLRVEAVE